jgi:fatty-acyl-CoA synthase
LAGMEYESFLLVGDPEPVVIEVENERDVAAINYTSGTTGLPKGVMYTHRGAFLNALGEILEARLDPSSVYLWTLPMFHCNGWCFTWAVTAIGGTHVCLRTVSPEKVFQLIEEEGVSHLCAAPTVLVMMSSCPGAKGLQLKRPLEIITAGAPPAPKIIENVESLGANITHVYGLTEVYGPHSVCAWKPEWDALPVKEKAIIKSRQGVPYIVAQYMDVVDPVSMQPVPRDGKTIGEIVMRGNNVMLGYYKDKEATEAAFAGGWFHSGDLAVMHPDGYVQIMDRQKDIIISGGENISTVEIENIIFRHPDVLEVAVISVPDDKWGEVPKAFVVPKDGRHPTEQGIIEFCKENLARFKAPKSVEFSQLPKTATGKIQKFKLREKEWQGRQRMVN